MTKIELETVVQEFMAFYFCVMHCLADCNLGRKMAALYDNYGYLMFPSVFYSL